MKRFFSNENKIILNEREKIFQPVTKILAAGPSPLVVVNGVIPVVPRANGLIDLKEEIELDIDSSKSGVMTL